MNIVGLIGNVTREIETKQVRDMEIATFGLAVNKKVKGEDRPMFIDCVAFGERAKFASQYISKGSKVGVTGELDFEQWEKDGQKRSKHKLIVNSFTFCDGKKDSAGPSQREAMPKNDNPRVPNSAAEDDCPF